MSEAVIRQRRYPQKGIPLKGESWWEYFGSIYSHRTEHLDCFGTQRTVSEGNQVGLLGHTDEDIGSDFITTKVEILNPGRNISVRAGSFNDTYKGHAGAVPPTESWFPPDLASSKSDLRALGATAISLVSPASPHANVLTSLGELRKEGLPSIPGSSTWRERASAARGAGSEYLNAQFGWVPLVSEVKAMADANRKAGEYVKQLLRDNGRNVRRRYDFPHDKSTTVETLQSGNGAGIPYTVLPTATAHYTGFSQSGVLRREREVEKRRWFSGAFTYYIPMGENNISRAIRSLQLANHLYGVALTPEVLWNLTPWSWATDWFANTGDILANASNAMMYGQILRYGYVMETTITTDTYTRECPDFMGGEVFHTVLRRTTKQRVKASPFGFGIDWDGFDAYQLSILAALGITRGKR